MNSAQLLIHAGFSKEQSKIYDSLLRHGSQTIGTLSKTTGLHRPRLYTLLPSLVHQGWIHKIQKGKRRHFTAANPQQLEERLQAVNAEMHEALPSLFQLYAQQSSRPSVVYLEGKEGITAIYKDLLATCKKGETFYRYESPKNYILQDRYLPRAYFNRVCKQRELQKLVITNQHTEQAKGNQLERLTKSVPANFGPFDYNATQLIYGNKVAFIDFNSETGCIIENTLLAHFQKQIFKLLFYRL